MRDKTHPDHLYTRPEAAEFLRVSVSTLERYALMNTGPVYSRIPKNSRRGRVLYRRADLEDFLACCRRSNTSE